MTSQSDGKSPSVSIIISTYNRCDALLETLAALGRQSVPSESYEIVVVDDGSGDETWSRLAELSLGCSLRLFRNSENRGVGAGRNLALRNAQGRYVILLSDDLIVEEDFIAAHLETLERYPGYWVVGGFRQLDSLMETSFGRYLDGCEKQYDQARKARQLGPHIWEMTWPTARNLSLPMADLERIGLFDEQFRTTCEDQDLAHRARLIGVRFLYNDAISCLHNDQAGDLKRNCLFHYRGAHDTALFCAKHPAIHGNAPIARVNGFISRGDSASLIARKIIKSILIREPLTWIIEKSIAVSELVRLPERFLWRLYRGLIGLYIFKGWRNGLRTLRDRKLVPDVQTIGYPSDI